jgi:hypothetical protein
MKIENSIENKIRTKNFFEHYREYQKEYDQKMGKLIIPVDWRREGGDFIFFPGS